MDDLDYSIVIPAYNEADKISTTITQVINFMQTFAPNFELLVVDDGSTDNTASIVAQLESEQPKLRLIRAPHKGKGASI